MVVATFVTVYWPGIVGEHRFLILVSCDIDIINKFKIMTLNTMYSTNKKPRVTT